MSPRSENGHPWAEYLGRQVRVTLTQEPDGPEVAEGLLLAFGDYGEAVIQQEDGERYYCWPMLKVEPVEAGVIGREVEQDS